MFGLKPVFRRRNVILGLSHLESVSGFSLGVRINPLLLGRRDGSNKIAFPSRKVAVALLGDQEEGA